MSLYRLGYLAGSPLVFRAFVDLKSHQLLSRLRLIGALDDKREQFVRDPLPAPVQDETKLVCVAMSVYQPNCPVLALPKTGFNDVAKELKGGRPHLFRRIIRPQVLHDRTDLLANATGR